MTQTYSNDFKKKTQFAEGKYPVADAGHQLAAIENAGKTPEREYLALPGNTKQRHQGTMALLLIRCLEWKARGEEVVYRVTTDTFFAGVDLFTKCMLRNCGFNASSRDGARRRIV
ncbi:MAG: hypothetical protein ACYDER_00685 [Ktedonobacteraceae bacterium]